MKNIPSFITIATTLIIIIGVLINYYNGKAKERLEESVYNGLKEALDEDLNQRRSKILQIIGAESSPNRKVKQVTTTAYNEETKRIEEKTYTFKDSIDLQTADKLGEQLFLSKKYPIQPDLLLGLLNSKLNVNIPIGILYWDGKQPHYSHNDSIGYMQADYRAEIDSIDLSYQLKVKAWANYGIGTFLSSWKPEEYTIVVILIITLLFISAKEMLVIWNNRKQEKRQDIKNFIKINHQTGCTIIDKTSYNLPPLDLQLLNLFLENPNRFLTKEEIKKELWDKHSISDNTLYVHIATVKNILSFHNYTIENSRNQGYQLKQKI
ncbi:winged helix-turn-helix domain-containing protein [Bacteroides caecicola]|uniref:Winged helix-turn-helix domain-containing protein n=1 Tax=Bacteroides caecicola TaxID=1462569 RepID=A0ABS2F845_9BACE|nr:helix-turn-helix domain-containing protein [Bacteroides caecicola]MBM6806276.1 winged helix-turn-helix domain-containing protein [Bacteroides caecicola]